ncbi:ATP-binding protein [Lysinibacillus sp. KU-BSD001]|uniref:ATP-binding protein n=1 Tax=Lysinibacillus sp. KU-BSD001 TaxID=3141328 RepID=UPI0036E8A5E9
MQQLEVLHKRNLFIYYSMTISALLYMIALFSGWFWDHYHYPIVILAYLAVLGFLFFMKTSPKLMQMILISTWNVLTVFLVIQSHYVFTFYLFIFLILMVSIYRSIRINVIVTLICSVQVAGILLFFFPSNQFTLHELIQAYIFFFSLVCIISITQAICVQKLWKKREYANMKREQEQASTEAYLRLFFEHAEDAIAVFDLNNRIREVNPAFEKLYGWVREECIGYTLPLVPPKNMEAAEKRRIQLLRGARFHLLETQDMKKDGTVFDAQISLSPIYDKHGEMIGTSVISRDISMIKENERLIIQSEKLKLAGELAAEVAHEIRNPMTVISGFVQMMNDDEGSPYKMYTELIQSEIERINVIVSEFLVLSRPQVETFHTIQIDEILQDILQLFSIEMQNRHIQYDLRLNHCHTTIHGNANQIKQVFINLIKNAMEAIDENGQLTIEMCNDEGKLYIYMKDTGSGIPPHLLERIFEPFYTTKSKGTGLGMMIINKIIQDHQGTITIQSEENIGTSILISFPNIIT